MRIGRAAHRGRGDQAGCSAVGDLLRSGGRTRMIENIKRASPNSHRTRWAPNTFFHERNVCGRRWERASRRWRPRPAWTAIHGKSMTKLWIMTSGSFLSGEREERRPTLLSPPGARSLNRRKPVGTMAASRPVRDTLGLRGPRGVPDRAPWPRREPGSCPRRTPDCLCAE